MERRIMIDATLMAAVWSLASAMVAAVQRTTGINVCEQFRQQATHACHAKSRRHIICSNQLQEKQHSKKQRTHRDVA
jgi:hypothetical protein